MNASDGSHPSARYEPRRLSRGARRGVLAVLVVAVIAAGVAVAFAYDSAMGGSDLKAQATRWEPLDASTMKAQISLTRDDPADPAVCVIRARNKAGDEVARREVYFPSTEYDTTLVTTRMRTSSMGGVVDVYGCTYDVPPYLERGA